MNILLHLWVWVCVVYCIIILTYFHPLCMTHTVWLGMTDSHDWLTKRTLFIEFCARRWWWMHLTHTETHTRKYINIQMVLLVVDWKSNNEENGLRIGRRKQKLGQGRICTKNGRRLTQNGLFCGLLWTAKACHWVTGVYESQKEGFWVLTSLNTFYDAFYLYTTLEWHFIQLVTTLQTW